MGKKVTDCQFERSNKEENSQVSVVILTYNEELNLPYALKSAKGWSDDIHIVDSESTDRTLDIAREFDGLIHSHPWKNWAKQRNWALDNCQLKYQWVLFLDADEQLTTRSQEEIRLKTQNADEQCCGFHLQFNYYFLNKLIRKAMSPHLRLVRKHGVRWKVNGAREVCSASDNLPIIDAKLIHHDHRGLKHWFTKQARNAQLEAATLYKKRHHLLKYESGSRQNVEDKLRHRLKDFVDTLCPPLLRTFLFFCHHLIFKTDIRDGWIGFLYGFLYGFCYPMMIDVKYIKLCLQKRYR